MFYYWLWCNTFVNLACLIASGVFIFHGILIYNFYFPRRSIMWTEKTNYFWVILIFIVGYFHFGFEMKILLADFVMLTNGRVIIVNLGMIAKNYILKWINAYHNMLSYVMIFLRINIIISFSELQCWYRWSMISPNLYYFFKTHCGDSNLDRQWILKGGRQKNRNIILYI